MSLSSGQAGAGFSSAQRSTTTWAVLLLAIATLLGVGLLHELDNGDTGKLTVTQRNNAPTTAPPASTPAATTTTPARTPAQVAVLVANGTGVSGVGAQLAAKLRPAGYNVLTPGNTTAKATVSQVQYATDYKTEAEAIANIFQIPAASVVPLSAPAPVADLGSANVVVVVGDELAATVKSGAVGQTTATTGAAKAPTGPLTSSGGGVASTTVSSVPQAAVSATTTTIAR